MTPGHKHSMLVVPDRASRGLVPCKKGALGMAEMMTLKEAREGADLTQEAAAHEAGLALRTYRRVETGKVSDPAYSTVAAICCTVGVDPGEVEEFARMGEKGTAI